LGFARSVGHSAFKALPCQLQRLNPSNVTIAILSIATINFFYVPVATEVALLNIFTPPSMVLQKKTKLSERCRHTQICHFTREYLVILYFNSGGIFQDLSSTSCLHVVLPSISLNLVPITAIKT